MVFRGYIPEQLENMSKDEVILYWEEKVRVEFLRSFVKLYILLCSFSRIYSKQIKSYLYKYLAGKKLTVESSISV